MEFQACDPCTVSFSFETRSPIEGRSDIDFAKARSSLSESHAIAVAMGVGAHVGIAGRRCIDELAEDDDAGGTTVDAQRAPRAHVVVDHEHALVGGVLTGPVGVDRFADGLVPHHEDALPWADVDTAFAGDALRLVDVD